GLFHAVGVNEKDDGQYKGPIEFDMVSGCALMIRREVFERIGQFDERFFCYFEEADLCFRARKAGYKVIAVPQSKVFHKNAFSSGGASSPSRIYYSVRNHLLFLEKNEPSGSLLSRWFKSLLVVANYMIFVVLGSDVPKSKGIRACFAGFKDYLHSKFGPLKL
ncbi:MAG: glycosyltransferase family 2 protein, partial [Candidatus Lindowbacteria bacterium]|nr:glycosyltransferase family 2 protein [Candidatus Lindowbacteria bacterium]